VTIDDADGIQHPRHPDGRELTGEHGLGEARRHETLCGKIIDFIGPVLLQEIDQADLIEQVTLHDLDPILDMANPVKVDGAGAPHHPDDVITLVQQKLSQVGTILAGDAGD